MAGSHHYLSQNPAGEPGPGPSNIATTSLSYQASARMDTQADREDKYSYNHYSGAGAGSGSGYSQHGNNCTCQQCYYEYCQRWYQWQQWQQYNAHAQHYYRPENPGIVSPQAHSHPTAQTAAITAYQQTQTVTPSPDTAGYTVSAETTPFPSETQGANSGGFSVTFAPQPPKRGISGEQKVTAEVTLPQPPRRGLSGEQKVTAEVNLGPAGPTRGTSGSFSVTLTQPEPAMDRELAGGPTIKFEFKLNAAPVEINAVEKTSLTYSLFKTTLTNAFRSFENLDQSLKAIYADLLPYLPMELGVDEVFNCVIDPSDLFPALRVHIELVSEVMGLSLNDASFFLAITCTDHLTNHKLFTINLYNDRPFEIKLLFDKNCNWEMKKIQELQSFLMDAIQHNPKKRNRPQDEKASNIIKIKLPKKRRGNLTKASKNELKDDVEPEEKITMDQIEFLTAFYEVFGKLSEKEKSINLALRNLVRSKLSPIEEKQFQKVTKIDDTTPDKYSYDEYHLWLSWPFQSGNLALLMIIKGLGRKEIASIEFYHRSSQKPLLILHHITIPQAKDYTNPQKNSTKTYFGICLNSKNNNWVIQIPRSASNLIKDLTNLAGYFYANYDFGPTQIHFVDESFKPFPELETAAQQGFIQGLNPLLQKSTCNENTFSFQYVYKGVFLDMELSRATKFHSWFISEQDWLARYNNTIPYNQSNWEVKVFGKTLNKKKRNEILNFCFSRRLDEIELHDIHAEEIPYERPNQPPFYMTGNEAVGLFYELNNRFFKIKKMSLCDEARLKHYETSLYFGISLPERYGVYLKLVNALANGSTWYQSKFKGLTLFEGTQKTKWDGVSDQNNLRRETCLRELQAFTIKDWYELLKKEQHRALQANLELVSTMLRDDKFTAYLPKELVAEAKINHTVILNIFKDGTKFKKGYLRLYEKYKSSFIINQEAIEKPRKLFLLCAKLFNLAYLEKEPDSIDISFNLQQLAQEVSNQSKSLKATPAVGSNSDLMILHDLLFDEVLINKLSYDHMADQWIKHRVYELVWNSRFWHCQIYDDKKDESVTFGPSLYSLGAGAGSGAA